jgi:lipopolysaccharide export system permease protein
MRILDRYIIRELIGKFIFGIAVFSSLFIGTGTLFRLARYMTKYGASMFMLTKLFVYSLPGIVVLTFPMSMLLASLLSFGRLSGSSEITAMRSSGISFYRLAAPVFLVAFGVSIFAVAFNELIVPQANTAYNNLVYYEIEKNTAPKSQEHIIIKDIQQGNLQRLIYARRYDAVTDSMIGVVVQQFENDELVRVENAESANWYDNKWVLYDGMIHNYLSKGEKSSEMRAVPFKEQVLSLNKDPKTIILDQKKMKEMSIPELKQEISTLYSQYVSTSDYEVELHQRVSIPMASLVFAMIGAPLGLQPQRSSPSIGLGISIIIIFIYYAIMTLMVALGQAGTIPAILAAWVPNIVGIFVGVYLVRKESR